jgi:uncharacterized FlaG/YvyC family protein
MNDLAYLVNQVQPRDPPIMQAHARYAEDGGRGEPTVLVFDSDTGEMVWRVPLTGLVQLAARFARLNPQLVLTPRRRPVGGYDEPPRRHTMNDLAYLVNRAGPHHQRPIMEARAEIIEHDEGQEPTVRVLNAATDEEVMAFPLNAMLRLAAAFKINTGLVFQGSA